MLITLCYLYLWLRLQRFYSAAIRAAIHGPSGGRRSFTFRALRPERVRQQSREPRVRSPRSPSDGALFLELGDKGVYISERQACEDLSKWTLLGSSPAGGQRSESVAFIIEATPRPSAPVSSLRSHKAVLNWADLCLPLAFRPGQPYRAVAQASLENFSRLGVAFLEDRLRMEDGLVPERIVSVSLSESALEQEEQRPDGPSEPVLTQDSSQNQNQNQNQHMDGHHLHLSSCHECLELENSTILSVRFASAENIPDLPDDCASVDPEAPEGPESPRPLADGKPPNVLVFTGGCELQFQRVRALLAEVVDAERYAIYPLRPQAALSDPWPQNTRLLVLASDQALSAPLQLRFLSYLSRGGRLLGLSSSLCPAGLTLRPRGPPKGQVCRLSFTAADSAELQMSVVASGCVYERDGAGAEVEQWGQIEREMAIVRVTHGADSGEAVLCQVRLEMAPDAHDALGPAGFSELKMSNALRFEVLTEILRALGLSCERSSVPPHGPLFLLSTHTEQKACFLRWLHQQTGGSGVLRSAAGVLRLLWAACGPDPADGERLFHLEPAEGFSELFSLQTYRQNLQTQRLGRTLVYSDATASTMDLLDGLVPQSPQEVGLIAIAARQTQGKGRGGNVWLSPLGCAMFTLHVCVPASSRLGQRLPFLQHLAALAVVQAVRTLPGYEDVDLRLKWPNDIYYSDLMKLGGVLVNSSLTGQTFSLLIGCGFNVSNSNPTVCINDLVELQNREQGRDLDPLTPEQLIGRTVTLLEQFISDFQRRGPEELMPLYYSRWVHGGARVRLWSEDGPEAEVLGLDEDGFLQVRPEGQAVVSVQPDGNSFDMLRNLLVIKSR